MGLTHFPPPMISAHVCKCSLWCAGRIGLCSRWWKCWWHTRQMTLTPQWRHLSRANRTCWWSTSTEDLSCHQTPTVLSCSSGMTRFDCVTSCIMSSRPVFDLQANSRFSLITESTSLCCVWICLLRGRLHVGATVCTPIPGLFEWKSLHHDTIAIISTGFKSLYFALLKVTY